MRLAKSEIRQIQCFVDAITATCRNLGITSRGYLPIGGRFPNEIMLKCKICGKYFGALICNPRRPWAVSVYVVEEVRGHKKHGRYFYREAMFQTMFFRNGRIEPQQEVWSWGVDGIDGWDLRMYGFDGYLAEYIMKHPPECDEINGLPFDSMKDALEYYAAWETSAERTSRIKRERRELKAFSKYI